VPRVGASASPRAGTSAAKSPVSILQSLISNLLQIRKTSRQLLNAFLLKGHGHFFVVAGDLAFDDDAIAEGGVAHFLAGVELGFAAGVAFPFRGGGCFAVGAGIDAGAAVTVATG